MEPFTHALLGGAAAYALTTSRSRLSGRERLALGATGGAFPDVDFAAFLVDPLVFLADWHQGPTHSIVLLPLWAALIGALFIFLTRRRDCFAEAVWLSGIGVASHIAADIITAYGTAVLYPLSAMRWSLGTTFVIDPLFTAIVLVGLALSQRMSERWPAQLALVAVCLYVAGQAELRQRAIEAGRSSLLAAGRSPGQVNALAQPFSPFNWKLIAVDGDLYREAHLNLVGHSPLIPQAPGLRRWRDISAAYRPVKHLRWIDRPRFGDQLSMRPLVEQLWNEPSFAPFRRFAVFPSLSRIDEDGSTTCVWFTDLRYDLPTLPDTFRYGFCRVGLGQPWQLKRLRYFSERSAQLL